MNKYSEKDEDLREVEHESITKCISLDLVDTKTIPFKEALVILKCICVTKNFCPELQLDDKVKYE